MKFDKKFSQLSVIVDNPDSWFWDHMDDLTTALKDFAGRVSIYGDIREIETGDILFMLSCDRIFKKEILLKHKSNIVIHASDLPSGKGWSPWIWQVEQGRDAVPLTLFEVSEGLDSGDWYIKENMLLEGHELIDEIREKLYVTIKGMVLQYIESYPMKPNRQIGEESFFERRSSKNQTLDVKMGIEAQFNKLRICDNERYPAHFSLRGKEYIIKIYKKDAL